MTNKKSISKLAKLTISGDGSYNKKVADYALSNFSRSELSFFLRCLKRIVSQNFVTVLHSDIIPEELKSGIEKKYGDKKILYEKASDVKNGVRIVFNDTVIDLTFTGHINKALESLRN